MSIYVVGDLHGYKANLRAVLEQLPPDNSTVILAGDVGLEYGSPHMVRRFSKNTKYLKKHMQESGHTWLVMRGNHDNCYWSHHVGTVGWAVDKDKFGYPVLYEKEYPNIYYIKDEGGIYNISGRTFLFVPGAYSVDKDYRIAHGLSWNRNEQLTIKQMSDLFALLEENDNKVDYIISHTYPFNIQNRITDLFLDFIDQDKVDKRTEKFLELVAKHIEFKHWYFGHLHDDRKIGNKYTMLYKTVANIEE